MELVARVVPKNKRSMGVSLHSLIERIPKMLGPLLGGVFISRCGVAQGVRLAFVAALGLAVLALVVQQVLIEQSPRRAKVQAEAMDLAPEERKAAMFGLYYLIRDVVVSLAAFGGAALWAIGPQVNLLAAFGFGVLGTTWFLLRGQDLPARTAGGS